MLMANAARVHAVMLLAGVTFAFACSTPDGERADSVAAGSPAAAAPSPPVPAGDTGCVLRGRWRLCSVEDRLDRAGLAPRIHPDTLRQPFMGVAGRVIHLGTAELQVFLYADAAAAAQDVAQLDPVRVAPPSMIIDWIAPPTLITSNNLVAILLSTNARQIERVRNALTAGLPPE